MVDFERICEKPQPGKNPERLVAFGRYAGIAGAFDFQSGFELVKLRAESMQLASEKRDGTMAAVLGLNDDKVNEICNNYNEGTVVVANYNCNGQVVISGDINSIKSILRSLCYDFAKRSSLERIQTFIFLNTSESTKFCR